MRKSIGSAFHQNNHPYLFLEPAFNAITIRYKVRLERYLCCEVRPNFYILLSEKYLSERYLEDNRYFDLFT